MAATQEEARRQIAELINKFEGERKHEQSEADVRAGYIDLLFLALGWNVFNDPGQMTNYRREGYVRGAGYVDIGLEIRGQPVLFLEAKRFDRIPASSERTGDRTLEEKQAFRYARGKKVTHAILTNFERLHLFNADHERLIYAFDSPQQYLDNFEELWRLSPGEVERGSLPWWEGQLEKRDVDLEFLAALRRWRLQLATAIYEHNGDNPALQRDGAFDFDRLMEAVQRILDRLILVRYGDDKEVLLAHDLLENMLADYRNRGAYARPDYLMRAFIDLSHMMDEHHNTALFEAGHVCEGVALPNEVLAKVIEEMNSISFRKFTSDILGNTYESYLGTKLVLRNGEIMGEERRDIRKGRGIYYTPRWVVEYIVDNTLGRRLKELEEEHGLRAIEKVRGLAVLDLACGSGSFLIYAYQVLANFYRRLNQAIAEEQARLVTRATQLQMFETLEELRHFPQPVPDYPQVILKEHLFGVDLDPEAAEIAAVNLTMQAFADSRQKKLPLILNENIKVGNSLISGTEEELRRYFGDKWEEKRHFNWREQFKNVMERGGFDVVIGNPPYVSYYSRQSKKAEEELSTLEFIRDTYEFLKSTNKTGRLNSVMFFLERAVNLACNGGYVGFIIDLNIFEDAFVDIRKYIMQKCKVTHIVRNLTAFGEVISGQVVLILQKEPNQLLRDSHQVCWLDNVAEPTNYVLIEQGGWLKDAKFRFSYNKFDNLCNTVRKVSLPLSRMFETVTGVQIGGTEIYDGQPIKDLFRFNYARDEKSVPRVSQERDDFYRYCHPLYDAYINFDVDLGTKVTKACFKSAIVLKKYLPFLKVAKILVRQSSAEFCATYTEETCCGEYSLFAVKSKTNSSAELKYLLGVVNSKLITFYAAQTRVILKELGKQPQIRKAGLEALPIRRIDFDNPTETKMHDDLVVLVERMLELNQRLAPIRNTPCNERDELLREIERTDKEINNLVYDLYGLTQEERAIVEGEASR